MERIFDLIMIVTGIALFAIGIFIILIGWNEAIQTELFIMTIILSVGGVLFMFTGFVLCLMGIEKP